MKLLRRLRHSFFVEQTKNFRSKYLQDDYEILGFLGQGSTSRVFLGHNILTNQRVVIKMFKPIPQDKILRQIRVNNKIKDYCRSVHDSPSGTHGIPIMQLLEVVQNKGCGSYALIFQYLAGSPMHITPVSVIQQKRFQFMHQILQSLDIVHSVGLIHRDLKPSNILITSQGAKLFDFGLCKQKGVDQLKTNRFGTKCYYPPQVVFRMPWFDQKLDIWTSGLIFSQLLTMIKPILPYKSDLQTLHQVINFCDYNQNQDTQVIPEEFKKFLSQKNHSKSFESLMTRMRINQSILPELNNEKFEILKSTIKKMLRINPIMRPSARQVINMLKPVFNSFQT